LYLLFSISDYIFLVHLTRTLRFVQVIAYIALRKQLGRVLQEKSSLQFISSKYDYNKTEITEYFSTSKLSVVKLLDSREQN